MNERTRARSELLTVVSMMVALGVGVSVLSEHFGVDMAAAVEETAMVAHNPLFTAGSLLALVVLLVLGIKYAPGRV